LYKVIELYDDTLKEFTGDVDQIQKEFPE